MIRSGGGPEPPGVSFRWSEARETPETGRGEATRKLAKNQCGKVIHLNSSLSNQSRGWFHPRTPSEKPPRSDLRLKATSFVCHIFPCIDYIPSILFPFLCPTSGALLYRHLCSNPLICQSLFFSLLYFISFIHEFNPFSFILHISMITFYCY